MPPMTIAVSDSVSTRKPPESSAIATPLTSQKRVPSRHEAVVGALTRDLITTLAFLVELGRHGLADTHAPEIHREPTPRDRRFAARQREHASRTRRW
jgi:hypothetical protein